MRWGWKHRAWRWATAWAMLGIVLFADAIYVIGRWSMGTGPAESTKTLLGRVHRSYALRREIAVACEDGRLRLVTGGEIDRIPESQRAHAVFGLPITHQWGIWTPFWADWPHSFHIVDLPCEVADFESQEPAVREQYIRFVEEYTAGHDWLPAWWAEGVRSGRGYTTRVNWWLLLHDVLFSVGLLAWLLAPLIAGGSWLAAWRERREAERRGCCAGCGYPLTGLPGARCPECGRERV